MPLIICDASLLILITKLEMLDLLIEVFKTILIPQEVYREAVEKGIE